MINLFQSIPPSTHLLPTQQQGHSMSVSNGAVIYLMPPRHYSVQARRPLVFNFANEFVNEAANMLSDATGDTSYTVAERLARDAVNRGALLPSANAVNVVRADMLSVWTFMMIITNEDYRRAAEHFGANAPQYRLMRDSQTIYYGHFAPGEEPINLVDHGRGQSYNPNAVAVFTHKTYVQLGAAYDACGLATTAKTQADVDLVQAGDLSMLSPSPTPLFMLTPDRLVDTIGIGDGEIVTGLSDHYSVNGAGNPPVLVESKLHNPYQTMARVFNAHVVAAQETASQEQFGTHFPAAQAFGSGGVWSGNYTARLADQLRGHDLFRMRSDIRDGEIHTLGALIKRYDVRVQVVPQHQDARYSVADQTGRTAAAQFSSLLATVVPAMMADLQILSIAIQYCSVPTSMAPHGEWQIGHVETVLHMAPDAIKVNVNSLKVQLIHGVLSLIKRAEGEFMLNATFNLHHTSAINLNFLDCAVADHGYHEVPTILGGLNSSLIADATVASTSGAELGYMLNCLTGADILQHAPPLQPPSPPSPAPSFGMSGVSALIPPPVGMRPFGR